MSAIDAFDASDWPEPILPDQARVPEIPTRLLPGVFGEMADAVCRATQTPPALAVMTTLAVLAICCQRRAVAPTDNDYREPLAIWTNVAMDSGTRKTAVQSALTAPLLAFEKRERDRLRPEVARTFAARAVAEKRIEHLKAAASKADDDRDRQRIQAEIARELESMPPEVFAPRLYVGDATPERVQALLVENGGAIAFVSDEAGVFAVLAGLYSGGAAVVDVLLQGHSGSPVRVDRQNRQAYIDSPRISMGLAIQPGVLQEACASPKFRHSGLLARFLFALPSSTLGRRDVRAGSSVPTATATAYAHAVDRLLAHARDHAHASQLRLNPVARESWFDFAQDIEGQLAPGCRLAHLADWAGKLPGQVARIAALLELAASGPDATVVTNTTMLDAIELGQLLTEHALAAFRLLGADERDADALAIFEWVRTHEIREFTRHEVHRALEGRLRNVERVKAALGRLAELHITDAGKSRKNPGARPSTVYSANPRLFT